jgi:hypothetical protein
MDSIDKLRVLLKHWIDHNGGHVDEFGKWREIMIGEKQAKVAESLSRAMQQMDEVSATLQKTLDELGGPPESSEGGHHHHHHHHH